MKNRILDNYLSFDGKEKKVVRDLLMPLNIDFYEINGETKFMAFTSITDTERVIVLNSKMFSTEGDKLFTLSYMAADYIINGRNDYTYVFKISEIDTNVYKLARKIYERRLTYSNIDTEGLKKILK